MSVHKVFITGTVIVVIVCLSVPLCGLEVSGRVVDGLGRSVEGVTIQFYCDDENDDLIALEQFMTDSNGYFQGIIGKMCWFMVSKKGYQSYAFDEIRQEIVIKKEVGDIEGYINKLLHQKGDELQQGLRELLASSEMESGMEGYPDLFYNLFKFNDYFAPPLRTLLNEPVFSEDIIDILCYFSYPEDIQHILSLANQKQTYYSSLAGALTSPTTEEKWDYLQRCILLSTEDRSKRYITEQAALALAINGGERALEILHRHPKHEIWVTQIYRSIQWILTHPKGLQGATDLKESAEEASGIFLVKGEEEKFGIGRIVVDRYGKKALVSCSVYHSPREARGYDMVFHKINDIWVLKGIWHTWIA